MAQVCKIETLDRSGRWYFTPGAKSIYDLRIRNDSNSTLNCSLVLEDPANGANIEPQSFALRGHEVRTVTVSFAADAPAPRSQRVLLRLRDDGGNELATFEQPLVIAGGSDCSISIALKDTILEDGQVRGFELACSVRSQSEGPTSFPLTFAPHPSLTFPPLTPVNLDPGQSIELTVPVRWNRDIVGENGINHPESLEVGVPVSNGRRTSRMRWDAIETQLQPFAWNNVLAVVQDPAPAANGDAKPAVAAGAATVASPANGAAKMPVAVPPVTEATPQPPADQKLNSVSSAPTEQVAATAPTAAQAADQTPQSTSAAAPPPIDLPLFNGVAPDSATFENQQEAEDETRDGKAVAELAAAAAAFSATLAPQSAGEPSADAVSLENAITARRSTAVAHRTQTLATDRQRKLPAGWVIGGLAALAIALTAMFVRPAVLQQAPSTGPVVINSPVIAANSAPPAASAAAPRSAAQHTHATQPKPLVKRVAAQPSPTASALAVATPQATPAPATPAPATPQPATTQPPTAVVATAPPPAAPAVYRRPVRRIRLAAPVGPVVALGGIEAHYGARGRAVRVNWSAAEQSAANVQLIDAHGTTLNSITVHGMRQSVLLYLPPAFHGPVTIQLTSIGRLGERVAQTAALPPFGG